MKEKNSKKTSLSTILLILAIIVIIIMSIFMFKLYNDKIQTTENFEKLQSQLNSLQNQSNSKSKNTTSNESKKNSTESEKPKIKIDEKKFTDMISSVLDLEDFENVNDLSDKDCLNAVYRKLYKVDNSNTQTYTFDEINSYVKSLFGKGLNSKASTYSIKYRHGKYEMVFADGDPIKKVKNVEFKIKDNKVYATFDVYTEDIGGNESDSVNYKATFLQDSTTNNVYINSKTINE